VTGAGGPDLGGADRNGTVGTDRAFDGDDQVDGDAVFAALLTRMGEAAPQPRLDPTCRALELLGGPHRRFPFIHVTGTNGKTSTTRMAAELLRRTGRRVGTFTSPHLTRFAERIAVDGLPASDEALATAWRRVQRALDQTDDELRAAGEPALTFFEALTILMFEVFAEADIDAAVIEVGMGGEWDSTNVADGRVAVITPISLDHTRQLGSSVAEIARTKSGIVKPGSTVVVARQTDSALAEISSRARSVSATIQRAGQDFGGTSLARTRVGQLISVRRLDGSVLPDVTLSLHGDHQADNAALAVAAVDAFLAAEPAAERAPERAGLRTSAGAPDAARALASSMDGTAVTAALGAATSPGRLQIIGRDPLVIVDAAHNPAGALSLAAALRDWPDVDAVAVVLGVLEDKDADGIIGALRDVAAGFYVTQSDSPRAIEHRRLASLVREAAPGYPVRAFRDPEAALESAMRWSNARDRTAVVITGSITLIGDAVLRSQEPGISDGSMDEGSVRHATTQ